MNIADITYAHTVIAFQVNVAPVVAHQGGWDELLLIAIPIVIVIGLLAVVKRRVERAATQSQSVSDTSISTNTDADLA